MESLPPLNRQNLEDDMGDGYQQYVSRIVVLKHSSWESPGELLKIQTLGYHPTPSKPQCFWGWIQCISILKTSQIILLFPQHWSSLTEGNPCTYSFISSVISSSWKPLLLSPETIISHKSPLSELCLYELIKYLGRTCLKYAHEQAAHDDNWNSGNYFWRNGDQQWLISE